MPCMDAATTVRGQVRKLGIIATVLKWAFILCCCLAVGPLRYKGLPWVPWLLFGISLGVISISLAVIRYVLDELVDRVLKGRLNTEDEAA